MGLNKPGIPDIIREDIGHFFYHCDMDLSQLNGKTVFVTGATGVIGYNLIHTFLCISEVLGIDLNVIAFVRNIDKAKALFGFYKNLSIVEGDVREPIELDEDIDYVVHAASITSSNSFVELPVDVIQTSVRGTDNTLRFAKDRKAKGYVYLSTMEVYGAPQSDELINESHGANIDTMAIRSSYPESKRACETLCRAYMQQYNLPVIVLRLTQTFGPGVSYNDSRVFAEFVRCAIERKNIVLHTLGETKRSYLYIADAVEAVLTAFLRGKPGEAYNVANEQTYCSIYDMAKLVCRSCADDKIDVIIQKNELGSFGYAPRLNMNLDCSKIRGLGWEAHYGLEEMFRRLYRWMTDEAC